MIDLRRLLLPAVIATSLFPLGFAAQYARTYFDVRAGKPILGQRASLGAVPWFKPEYRNLVRRLKEHLPADAPLFIEPSQIAKNERAPGGRTRWFLYLANDLYPHKVYVRSPKLASGTLVDYPVWMDMHFEILDVDKSGLGLGAAMRRDQLNKEADIEIQKRGIQWKLTYPISTRIRIDELSLYKRTDEAQWEPVDLLSFLHMEPKQ